MEQLKTIQELFAHLYRRDLNGTGAAKQAGYSPKTARRQATRLLSKVHIRERIEDLLRPRLKKAEVEGEKVIQRLSTLAMASLDQFCDWDGEHLTVKRFEDIPKELRAAVSKIKVTEHTTSNKKEDNEYTTRTVEVAMETRHPHLKTLMEYLKLIGKDVAVDNRTLIVVQGNALIGGEVGKPEPDGIEIDVEGMLEG